MKRLSNLLLAVIVLVKCVPVADAGDKTSVSAYFDETQVTTLFAFDNHSIPFTRNLKLQMRSPERHPANPVVKIGADGTVDSWAVQFYGSVIREPVSGKFRMWYCASSNEERRDRSIPRSALWRVAYAESDDGVNWTKPNLGLVESQGNTNNNLVRLDPHLGVLNVKVLHEPDDPNPEHRYKMAAHVWFPKNKIRLGTIAPYVSADGLTWKLLTDIEPVAAEFPEDKTLIPPMHFEPVGGFYKWDGLYHLSGQNANPGTRLYHGRVTRKFISSDFLNWSQGSAIAFVRTPQHKLLGPGESLDGEQTHEGVSVWNRGNVLVGNSGMWHGAKQWKDVRVDLGFNISNDGIHFREPAHEHVFLKRGADGEWDQGGVLQAQGFENVDDQTFIYYGACDYGRSQSSPPRGGVGIATLPRDRFADLVVDESTTGRGNYQMLETVSSFMTTSVPLEGEGPHRFYVNADGLGKEAALKVELLDHQLRPIPQCAAENAAIVRSNGFQTPIICNGQGSLKDLPDRVRVRVTFEGRRKASIRFNAIYIQNN